MKTFIIGIILYALRVVLAGIPLVAAAYLAVNGKDGWGWFLLLAFLIAPGQVSVSSGKVE